MKIELTYNEKGFPNAYRNVIEVIDNWCRTVGYYTDFIVRIKTVMAGNEDIENVYLSYNGFDNEFEFDTDWYEGGEVELLGFIPIEKIEIPDEWKR